MTDGLAFVDGEYVAPRDAKISIFDLGFLHSDSTYDVVSTWKGWFFRLDDHVERFNASCAGLRLKCPHEPEALKRILARCVDGAGLEDAYVEMIVTRGPYPADGSRDLRRSENRFFAFAIPYAHIAHTQAQRERGIGLRLAGTPRIIDASIDMRFKNYHWGDLTSAYFEALDSGDDNALLCRPDGVLAEGPGFNVFLVDGNTLKTPGTNCLRGITRQTVHDLAAEIGLGYVEGEYTADDLARADEIFLTSTAGGVMPVTRLDGTPIGDGTVGSFSAKLRDLYWSKREAGWLGTRVSELLA